VRIIAASYTGGDSLFYPEKGLDIRIADGSWRPNSIVQVPMMVLDFSS
jgi:hypothetical protein